MPAQDFVSPDSIRAQSCAAMSLMYKQEVPLYGTLRSRGSGVNLQVMTQQPEVAQARSWTGESELWGHERPGATGGGTAEELAAMAGLFSVMGMPPVGDFGHSWGGVPEDANA
ncbi:2-oxoadipate dioxygenase/decarboxylase family protein, partial [Neisseria cinerea]|uniref:2-oxoadipate dioxygenase/decarboxylase family protein n=1 Tax=Neisseria cinerea TaxID=483 RepID=UPI00396A2B29